LATFVGSTSAAPPVMRALRRALLARAALALVTGVAAGGLTDRAAAQGYSFNPYSSFNPYRSFNPYLDPDVQPRPTSKARPRAVPKLETDSTPDLKSKAKSNQKPEPGKDAGAVPKGPLQIVVSVGNQHVTLYSNGTRVAQSPVSTGVPDRPTPTGVFSIIQKDRFHHSNLYSNAPMPYMERITWSGVALHEGPLPGYPASHGCIRLTHEFAERLWVSVRLGVRVIVARSDVVPVDFAHPRLFVPKAKPAEPPSPSEELEKHVAVAQLDPNIAASPTGGLRGTVDATGSGAGETTATVAAPASAPVAAGEQPASPPASAVDPPKPDPDVADPAKLPPLPVLPKARSAEQPPKHAGTVAVFISRREKKLFVRQGFAPLFDVPVEIEHPEQPFGTHVLTALGLTDNGTRMRWNLMTMPAEPRPVIASKIGSKGHIEAKPAAPDAPQTAAQVLDRIQIPQEAVDRIDEILTPGASLVISDQGLGPETGEGTDFIVLGR
jgi:lipoprotein-anchoring transpeptidase ErfK/SrfK